MITLYGIKNCDTVKKARNWLDTHAIDYQFHDFRADGIEATDVAKWIDELGWEGLVNKRSTSWKSLEESIRSSMNNQTAQTAILAQPTLIKRPLLELGEQHHVGFSASRYQELFGKHTL
ncbi:MAG: ArsC family reductase [Halioglobus sp.]